MFLLYLQQHGDSILTGKVILYESAAYKQQQSMPSKGHTTMHSRGGFVDWDEEEKRRLLLRLWINIPNGRALAPDYADRLNTGGRGGVTKRL